MSTLINVFWHCEGSILLLENCRSSFENGHFLIHFILDLDTFINVSKFLLPLAYIINYVMLSALEIWPMAICSIIRLCMIQLIKQWRCCTLLVQHNRVTNKTQTHALSRNLHLHNYFFYLSFCTFLLHLALAFCTCVSLFPESGLLPIRKWQTFQDGGKHQHNNWSVNPLIARH